MTDIRVLPLLCAIVFPVTVFGDYDAGSRFAHEQKGKGTGTMQNMKPEEMIPGYTANPPEGGYYGGVQAGAASGLESAGADALHKTEAGNTVTDVIKNRPPDRPDLDAPFISNGLTVHDNAETVTGGTSVPCKDVTLDKTDITTHYCERSPAAELACTRTAKIAWKAADAWETQRITIPPDRFTYSYGGNGIDAAFVSPVTGTVQSATLDVWVGSNRFLWNTRLTLLNSPVTMQNTASFTLNKANGFALAEGQTVRTPRGCPADNTNCNGALIERVYTQFTREKTSTLTLRMMVTVKVKTVEPYIEWVENCPFDKSQEVKLSTQCTEAGGTRTVEYGGKQYPVYSDCWQYTDNYITQDADNGSCDALMKDPACTLAKTTCTEQSGAACLREQAVFSCEKKVSAAGQLCGMDLVCTDGKCDEINSGGVNDFQQAVSALAAVAAAGEDVAALNDDINVRAFTGQGQSCRKAAAGFSNCCKNSGWGNDVGLAGCDSEEKAIGKAKDRKLAVYVGTDCSKKVLGVCLQKKEGYCVFDSKLAKIVQEQGRSWQLGIGFGSGNNPDCRGITIEELQAIDFGRLNFADFYEDMENGTDIPSDQALIDRVKEQISNHLQQGTQP
ncbi:TPA: type-F conjugative transfer system mating-pair stabilization protein TraN [Morganella morganii subsp. morganii]|nr:type-F conjugative transfer system mating-pair stabilization protein TraN [Morganella morganii subsp. morganii]